MHSSSRATRIDFRLVDDICMKIIKRYAEKMVYSRNDEEVNEELNNHACPQTCSGPFPIEAGCSPQRKSDLASVPRSLIASYDIPIHYKFVHTKSSEDY